MRLRRCAQQVSATMLGPTACLLLLLLELLTPYFEFHKLLQERGRKQQSRQVNDDKLTGLVFFTASKTKNRNLLEILEYRILILFLQKTMTFHLPVPVHTVKDCLWCLLLVLQELASREWKRPDWVAEGKGNYIFLYGHVSNKYAIYFNRSTIDGYPLIRGIACSSCHEVITDCCSIAIGTMLIDRYGGRGSERDHEGRLSIEMSNTVFLMEMRRAIWGLPSRRGWSAWSRLARIDSVFVRHCHWITFCLKMWCGYLEVVSGMVQETCSVVSASFLHTDYRNENLLLLLVGLNERAVWAKANSGGREWLRE